MYRLVAFVVVALVAQVSAFPPANITKVAAKCEVAVMNATIGKLSAALVDITSTTWPTPIMCLLACVEKGIGMMTTANVLNQAYPSLALPTYKQQPYKALFADCATVTNTDECLAALEQLMCLRMNGPKHLIFLPVFSLLF